MGSKPSKPSETVALTTTTTTTTTTVPSTFPSQTTTTVSHCTEDCKCQVEIVLAFFGGILAVLLICAIVFSVIKMKDKVKIWSGLSRCKSQERESSNGAGVHPLETTDENVSYASLRFVKRDQILQERTFSTAGTPVRLAGAPQDQPLR